MNNNTSNIKINSEKSKENNRRLKSVDKRAKARAIKSNLFLEDEEKSKKNAFSPKNGKAKVNFCHKKQNEPELPKNLSRELFKKQQEQIDFNKKFEFLKKRIEKLKVEEEKIRLEKNYNKKKETQKGKNLADKVKQKSILEEYKKEQIDKMRNKKKLTKKRYEEENKILKTYGSEVSLRNREFYMKLKEEKEKLKEKEKQNDKEYLEKKKNKMLAVKNRNIEIEKDFNMTRDLDNKENENNQKMNYIYTSKRLEELKQNCDELEKLEQEYIKKIEEGKKDRDNNKQRVFSAIKADNKK